MNSAVSNFPATRHMLMTNGTTFRVIRDFLGSLPTAAISRLMSEIEGHPIPLHSQADRRKGGQFARKLKNLQLYGHRVPCGSVYRQAFLWGAANYLKGFEHEELILGFGIARGARTCINSIMKFRGNNNRVDLSTEACVIMHDFLNQNDRHAVLLVHNHPDNQVFATLLGFIFGEAPMPSMADRDCALSVILHRLESVLQGSPFGRIRFYLVQNDGISEFSGTTPALLLDVLRNACLERDSSQLATEIGVLR